MRVQNLDDTQIKERLMETSGINLFDSGKNIPSYNPSLAPQYYLNQKAELAFFENLDKDFNNKPVSLETFLTKTMKLDITSGVGKTVYERLANAPQEVLNRINVQKIVSGNDYSKWSLNEVAGVFDAFGVDILTQNEHEIEASNREAWRNANGIPQQEMTAEMLANMYDQAATMLENYYHNHGVFDFGTYFEGFKNIVSWVTPDSICGIDFRNTLQIAKDCRKAAEKFRNMHTQTPMTFSKEFK